jgi:phage tail sheath protein FI
LTPPVASQAPPPSRRLEPIPTSVTIFIGRTTSGPMFTPVACQSLQDYDTTFSPTNPHGDLSRAVRLFFHNAGPRCHVVRIRNREVQEDRPPRAADYRDALVAISIEVPDFNLLVLPRDESIDPATQQEIWRMASHFCREKRAMLLIDAPSEWAGLVDVQDAWSDLGITRAREGVALESAAMFYPRVMVQDGDAEVPTGCCGAMAGLMTSFDDAHGVWTPAAGLDAIIAGIYGLEHETTEDDASLFMGEGVDVLRTLPEGVVSWGARTMAGHTGSWWKFIPVRRMALFVEQSIERGIGWVAGESNDPLLWQGIQASVGAFLDDIWKRGALEGDTAEKAYFVQCDAETTTADDIARGQVHFHVGFAPMRPEEFMVLEFTQSTR